MQTPDENDPAPFDKGPGQWQNEHPKLEATRVDDKNKEHKDLKRALVFGNGAEKNTQAPGMEGQGMGGHKFGQENHPPTGNDPNNPSQNAGTSNAFLANTDPLEERPENNNFKVQSQQGEPDYDGAQPYAKGIQDTTHLDGDGDERSEYME